jgi:hypothetical protein
MKPLYLLLNLLFVAGGLYVYDTVVRPQEPAAPTETAALRTEAPPPASPHAAPDLPPPLRLEGVGHDAWRSEVEMRLRELEALRAARTTVVRDEGPTTPTSTSPLDTSFLPEGTNPSGDVPQFRTEDVATFRRLLEAVEQQRREEGNIERFDRVVERLGLQLTDSQRAQARKANEEYTGKIRDAFRGSTERIPREERATRLAEMREEYRQVLYTILPAADADQLLGATSRSFQAWNGEDPRPPAPRLAPDR